MQLILHKLAKRSFKLPLPLSSIKREFIHSLLSIALIWQVLFFYFPILFLFITSFSSAESASLTFKHLSPIMNATYFKTLGNSLVLSLVTAVICLLITFPLMYFIVFKTKKWKYTLLFLLIIPFWTNFVLNIYAWFFILEKNGLLNRLLLHIGAISEPLQFLYTPFASLLLMVYYYLPFVALPIFSALERFDTTFYEASLTLGAGKFKTLYKITLPLIEKAIIVGFFLVFIPAFGEFLIPEFMGGDKIYYVGNVISIYVLGGITAPVGIAFASLSICFLLITSFLIYLVFKTLFRTMQGNLHDSP